ncbi:MAG: hypothetical protein RLY58_1074 [Pseudomonadota bacterium]|jgi:rhomboid family GlyGly-CTERM serine protease
MQPNRRVISSWLEQRTAWADGLLMVMIMVCMQPWRIHLMYARHALGVEPWRWLTGHWVHANGAHLLLNAVALLLLPAILPAPLRRQWWGWLMLLSILISLALFFFHSVLQNYVGLSGVLHGLYVATAVTAWSERTERRWIGLMLLVILIKLLVEPHLHDLSTEKLIGVSVFFVAHQWGAFFGLILGLLSLCRYNWPILSINLSKNGL